MVLGNDVLTVPVIGMKRFKRDGSIVTEVRKMTGDYLAIREQERQAAKRCICCGGPAHVAHNH